MFSSSNRRTTGALFLLAFKNGVERLKQQRIEPGAQDINQDALADWLIASSFDRLVRSPSL